MKARLSKKTSHHYFNWLFFLFFLLLPTQFGRHFFLPFSYLSGVRIDYLAPTIYLTDVIGLLLIIFNRQTVFNFFRNKKVLLILGLFLINLFFSLSKFISVYYYIKILGWLSLFVIFKKNSSYLKKSVFLPFFIAGLLELVLVILQFVNKRSIQGVFYFLGERYMTLSTPGIAKATLQGTELLRPYGTFSHPNSLAGFYLLLYFFVLTNKSIRNNLLKYPLLFISTVLVFFSFSKIAIVTLLILNTLYLMLKINKCKVCLLAKLTVPIIVGFIFFSAQTDPLSLDKRLALVANAWQTFLNHPLFGVGLGSYLVAQNQFPIKYPYFFLQPVHNIFLLFLSETGIIISGSVLWILIKKIKKTFLTTNYLLLVAVFITGFFDHYWLTLQQNILLLIYLFSTL